MAQIDSAPLHTGAFIPNQREAVTRRRGRRPSFAPDTLRAPDPYENAECRQEFVDPEWFFPAGELTREEAEEEGVDWSEYQATVLPEIHEQSARARAVCARCPLWQRCLTDHLGEEFGVWGGFNPSQRQHIKETGELPQGPSDGYHRNMTKRDSIEVTEAFVRGERVEELATEFGVTRKTVLRVVRQGGL